VLGLRCVSEWTPFPLLARANTPTANWHIELALPHVRAQHTAHFARGTTHKIDPPHRCGSQRMVGLDGVDSISALALARGGGHATEDFDVADASPLQATVEVYGNLVAGDRLARNVSARVHVMRTRRSRYRG
jgi:hypothetical protein